MRLLLKRTPGVFLVGFMGSGKSTVGRALAEDVGWTFVDLDDEIERSEGSTIPAIFERQGEAAFRELEARMLVEFVKKIQSGRPHVVSLGGGAFVSEENVTLIGNNGVSIWLDCPLEKIEARVAASDHRPLARDVEKMRALYASRIASYARADYHVTVTSDDAQATVAEIKGLPLF